MEIIIDRKKKRAGLDNQWHDPLGVEQARANKAREIEVDTQGNNPIDKYLLANPLKSLVGKKVWGIKDDKSRTYCGWVVDVYPGRILLVKVNSENIPINFEHIISMEVSYARA